MNNEEKLKKNSKNAKSLKTSQFLASTRKILDDFQDYPLLLSLFFFDDILDDFHDIFAMCLVPEENQQPFWRSHRFSEESGNYWT